VVPAIKFQTLHHGLELTVTVQGGMTSHNAHLRAQRLILVPTDVVVEKQLMFMLKGVLM
jgi:hypothetical protein